MDLPEGVSALIPPYLARQRWYAGTGAPESLSVVSVDEVAALDGHRLLRAVVAADDDRYQILIGERPNGEPADFLKGHEAAVLGPAGDWYYYDAALDPELALALLEVVTDGTEHATRMRPITAQQSNTSLVYDDRIILKVFRRLQAGRNPDIEVTTALAAAGFDHVATPIAVCRDEYGDLAFAQRYLAGGSEGWALALTSLRDLYATHSVDPESAGGDFAGEARRLGQITAQMHLAMAQAFGVERQGPAERRWVALLDAIDRRLAPAAAALGGGSAGAAAEFMADLRTINETGPAIRVHGDYHLGQVMWTDTGWFVLDFEGEPARPLAARTEPCSPIKDVSGMVRSFHYASRAALGDRREDEVATLEPAAEAWERRNRTAFVDAYRATPGIHELLPDGDAAWDAALSAFEMDKALYELDYERAYRPEWAAIPLRAVARLLTG
jgi:maltokinase